jgi:hypothetical protein
MNVYINKKVQYYNESQKSHGSRSMVKTTGGKRKKREFEI